MKDNGSIVKFLRGRDYEMVNNSLGAGSFGKTVLLKDPFIDELFVAKKYEPYYEEDRKEFYDSFLQEIKIMYKLNHKNVVRIYNYYAYEAIQTGYIIMEYIDGQNIADYLEWYSIFADGSDPSPDEVFSQLIDAFSYIESKGILHRDIREGNILIDKSGLVKVIDFGLGKTFLPVDSSEDSMAAEINRSGLDKLPNEYFEGKYTSRTDMFYLAELIHRLLNNNNLLSEFSYGQIVEKMMESNESNRYSSFKEVREAIDKKDFTYLSISESDKEIYQNFSNALCRCISSFPANHEFVKSVNELIERLRNVLKKNSFEYYIQNNRDLIYTVEKQAFRYYPDVDVECKVVSDFLNWLDGMTSESQNLVFSNLISKLSIIEVELDEEDVPF
ncbi:MAG: protein kinase family protein [Oscillospiraceae bacterium]|nr:protein kinase family protein [Oscillospiraceae bacterium]